MRILYLTCAEEDYLSDALLHGFRMILSANVVDYPRKDILYWDCPATARKRIRGGGFTLYTGLLTVDGVDRSHITHRLQQGEFDLIVFSDIWRQFSGFVEWRRFLHPKNTILVDGSDSPQVYPHAGFWWRRPWYWFLPRATHGFLYFKREWTENSQFNLWHRLVPRRFRRALPRYRGLRRISFSIPQEKIVAMAPRKSKDYTKHIVDPEVAAQLPGSSIVHTFNSEEEYYGDLQSSRFGITTKRSGWDCLRHYELAANGCVPCFRDLDKKPANCAPHGLDPGKNCLSYRNAEELFQSTANMGVAEYTHLQAGALKWVQSKTTCRMAEYIVNSAKNWEKAED